MAVTAAINRLLEDLDGLDERRKHYTGQLTLEAVPEQSWKRWDEDTWLITGKGYKPFYIVDGQQRLATALILIKCILDRVPETGSIALTEKTDLVKRYLRQIQPGGISRAYLFGYEKDNPSYEFFKTKAQLGVKRTTLIHKMKKLGISRPTQTRHDVMGPALQQSEPVPQL